MPALIFLMPLALSANAPLPVPLFASSPLDDEELAQARGGFELPSGVEIAFGAVVTTSVDGLRLLETRLQLEADGLAAATASAPAEVSVRIDGGSAKSAVSSDELVAIVELPDLTVRHSVGREISSVVVNTADNRVVDTRLSINLQMDNVQPLSLGSIGFRVQAPGLEAALLRVQ